MKQKSILLLIILLAFFLRIYGVNWDQGFHLHPDERMLIIVTERIEFPNQLNPNFFNYGSLPIYLLAAIAQFTDIVFNSQLDNYKNLLLIGRRLSILFDLLTIILIYKIALFLFKNKKVALFSSFFYAIVFFSIQNAHFFTVDVFLTFLSTLLIYLLLKLLSCSKSQNKYYFLFLISITSSAMLTTKFTAIIFLPMTIGVIFLMGIKQLKNLAIYLIIFIFSFFTFNFIFMPYAFLNYKKFIADITLQIKMNNDPYIFPYTLQYVGTIPYFYYLKNIFLWGAGPMISILSFIGLLNVIYKLIKKNLFPLNHKIWNIKHKAFLLMLYVTYYIFYFLIIGQSAVKFMRYMLPIYPFLAIMAGIGLDEILKIKNIKFLLVKLLNYLIIFFSFIWTLFFINIYSQPHTRLAATNWILKNIPIGSTLAIEHWDDSLPLYGQQYYQFVEMTLYEQPDDEKKWQILNERLKLADYIIIASNRLYIPIQKLANCQKYKICYPKTAQYYQKLFKEELGFKKVAEFTAYPKISIFNLQFSINDQKADESFTVYDHPKIMIFKKLTNNHLSN